MELIPMAIVAVLWVTGTVIIEVQFRVHCKQLKIIKKFLTENWEVLDKEKLLEVAHMIKKLPLSPVPRNNIYREIMCFCFYNEGNIYYIKQSLKELYL